MRPIKKLAAALVLTLMLSLSAYAGVMETGVTSTPPPPTNSTSCGVMETGFICTATPGDQPASSSTLTLLTVLQMVLPTV